MAARATLWSNGTAALTAKYECLGVNVAAFCGQDRFPGTIGQLIVAQNSRIRFDHCEFPKCCFTSPKLGQGLSLLVASHINT